MVQEIASLEVRVGTQNRRIEGGGHQAPRRRRPREIRAHRHPARHAAIFNDLEHEDYSLEYFNKILSVNPHRGLAVDARGRAVHEAPREGNIIHQSSTAAYIGNAGAVDTSDPDKPSPSPHY